MMRIQLPSGGTAIVSKDIRPETVEALDQMCKAILTQKQIVDCIRQRSELKFFHLVYLCWSVDGHFDLERVTAYQWSDVLGRLREWKNPPDQQTLEYELCNCRRIYHLKTCPAREFREAVN